MGIVIKGVNCSYDYDELLSDLELELDELQIGMDSYIQVLRSEKAVFGDYRPIVDYYYDEKKMKEILTYDVFDDEDEKEEVRALSTQYLECKPKLEQMLVRDVIKEMKDISKII